MTPIGSTPAFGRYAAWYDRFHEEKDYEVEARYLLSLLARFGAAPKRWLDVGCGTGRHLASLAARGIAVEGVDRSADMIRIAREAHPGIEFHVGDASSFRLAGERDVVSLLFHAFSYLTEDDLVAAALQRAAEHLGRNGTLLFDFWHTPALRADPPSRRVRSVEIEGRPLYRISTPSPAADRHVVEVKFEFRWDAPDGALVHEELHELRHFGREELERFLRAAGLAPVAFEAWERGRPLSDSDWYGVACARLA